MTLAARYLEAVSRQLDSIAATQADAIEEAGARVARCLLEDRWVYLFGTGHSHLLAEELFYRAGGLPCVRPILRPDLMLHVSASESTRAERDAGRVEAILRDYPMAAGDLLVIASNSGRNPVPVELALQAGERGVSTVALINRRHAAAYPSRHPSGRHLDEVADLVIDNGGLPGDACVELPGAAASTGATSTVTGAAILQMIACSAIEQAMKSGWTPRLFTSANASAGADADNRSLVEELRARGVRHI